MPGETLSILPRSDRYQSLSRCAACPPRRSLADSGGKVVSPAKFERHFALDGADWFPRRLYVAFLSAQRMLDGPPEAERLTLEGFREGGAPPRSYECWSF